MLRAINERALLGLVDRHGPLSRVDLAAMSGLSKPTVSAALGGLLERRAVVEAGRIAGRKGPAAALYALDPGCARSIGVDLGHDVLKVALSDAVGEVQARREEPVQRDADALVSQVRRLCADVAGGPAALDGITRLVVGLPAAVTAGGRDLHHGEGLPMSGGRLGHALAAALPAPLTLENDVNLAALAEASLGHGV